MNRFLVKYALWSLSLTYFEVLRYEKNNHCILGAQRTTIHSNLSSDSAKLTASSNFERYPINTTQGRSSNVITCVTAISWPLFCLNCCKSNSDTFVYLNWRVHTGRRAPRMFRSHDQNPMLAGSKTAGPEIYETSNTTLAVCFRYASAVFS